MALLAAASESAVATSKLRNCIHTHLVDCIDSTHINEHLHINIPGNGNYCGAKRLNCFQMTEQGCKTSQCFHEAFVSTHTLREVRAWESGAGGGRRG